VVPRAQGAGGTQGATGSQGSQGASGSQGAQGAGGAQGAAGSQGSQGASGSQGAQGASGAQGSQGAQGATGSAAVSGYSITVENPDDSEDITIAFTNRAITVTEMRAVLLATIGAQSVTWTIRHQADRSNVGNEVVTGGTQTQVITTGTDVIAFDDATIGADSFIWLETTEQGGTVTELHVSVIYTVD